MNDPARKLLYFTLALWRVNSQKRVSLACPLTPSETESIPKAASHAALISAAAVSDDAVAAEATRIDFNAGRPDTGKPDAAVEAAESSPSKEPVKRRRRLQVLTKTRSKDNLYSKGVTLKGELVSESAPSMMEMKMLQLELSQLKNEVITRDSRLLKKERLIPYLFCCENNQNSQPCRRF